MTQRPVNYSSKAFCRDAMLLEDHAPGFYASRPTLYSVKNIDRLATESTRARRLILTTAQPKCSRDFASCFQSSENSGDPQYVASHTSSVPVPTRSVVPTFAMTQSLRWNPHVETSSIEDVSYAERDPNYNCRCANCSTRNCPSRISSSSTLRSGSNRNKIMTFADIYTMTPKLTDAGCGSSVVPSTRFSETSASVSDIAVRDTRTTRHIDQRSGQSRNQPIPILKNTRRHCDYNASNTFASNCIEFDPLTERHQEAERDVYDHEPSRVSSIRSFFRSRKTKKDQNDVILHNKNRRIIYNEGISDVITNRCPLMPIAVPSDANDWRHNSRACLRNRTGARNCDEEENQIPHSQMVNSKYHKNCKARNKIYFYDNEEAWRTIRKAPKMRPRNIACSKTVNLYQTPCIKLPKKVLTSQINIESYGGPRCQHRFGPVSCDRWKVSHC